MSGSGCSGYLIEYEDGQPDGYFGRQFWRKGHGWKPIEKATVFRFQNQAVNYLSNSGKIGPLLKRRCCVVEVSIEYTVGRTKYPRERFNKRSDGQDQSHQEQEYRSRNLRERN